MDVDLEALKTKIAAGETLTEEEKKVAEEQGLVNPDMAANVPAGDAPKAQ